MREIVFKLVIDTDGTHGKLERVEESLDELKEKGEKGSFYTFETDANGKLRAVKHDLEEVQEEAEKPKKIKVSADQALATIRDVKIAFDGVAQVFRSVTTQINEFLDANLKQKQAMQLANHVFNESSQEIANYAREMQALTNYGDEQLIPLMAKLSQTFKLSKDDILLLVPVLLDFAEANKVTGMSVESAFDLMGRALNGHTEMLVRYGIELDDTRLKQEGVTYLVEKLGEDYGGTAKALADLRTQNANAWGDIKETIGSMLETLITPLFRGLQQLMDVYNDLSPVMKGFVTGVGLAIPVVVSLATGLTALVAAVNALKIAINPVTGIISMVAGAATVAGMSIAAASVSTNKYSESHDDLAQSIRAVTKEISLEAEKFSILASRLLELRSATSLTNEQKTEMQSIVRQINSNYSEYIGNINMETASYNDLKAAVDSANDALISKMTVQVYENLLVDQVEKLAEAKVSLSTKMNELLDVSVPSTQDNFMKVAYDQLKMLESRFSDYSSNPTYRAIRDLYEQVKIESNILKGATREYDSAVSKIRGLLKNDDSSAPNSGVDNEERRLEQLQALQQRYDVLAIDDATARRQKELEIQRDAELAKAESLGASEELLQGIRDYYSKESIRVEQEAADARRKAFEEAKQKALEAEERHQQELENVRYEFEQRGLNLNGRIYDAQLAAVDRYYTQRKDKLLSAGLTEQQITEQSEIAKQRIRDNYNERALQGISRGLGDLAKTSEVFGKKGFALWKTISVGQALVDTYASANAAYKAMAGIPVIGPGLAVAAAAAAISAGLANVAIIANQEPPKAATGGLLVGRSHNDGGILIEAEGDEYITAKERVRAIGKGLFDFLNFAPLEQVKKAFSGFSVPSIPIPDAPSFSYAGGGSVGTNGLAGIIEAINDKMAILVDKNVEFNIHIDPLANDPVKVSEISDIGKQIRSEV